MDRTALIVGGTGQIGVAVSVALLEAGYRVTVAHRGTRPPAVSPALEHVRLDREDTPALLAAARGRDLVVDIVAYTPAHAAQLAQLAGAVGSLVVISTGSVYMGRNNNYFDIAKGDDSYPDFPVPITELLPTIDNDRQTYGPLKAAMERALLALDDIPVSILRPAAIHGPGSPKLREWYFIKRALDRRPHVVLARNGDSRFSTSSTLNIAALVTACAARPGSRVLNAVDEENLTTAQIASVVFDVMEHHAEILGLDGAPRGDLGATPWDTPRPFVCSMQKARDEVGYSPAVTYRQAVEVDVDWVTRTLAEGAAEGKTWHDQFPSVVARYGPDGWFPYEAEDRWVEAVRHH